MGAFATGAFRHTEESGLITISQSPPTTLQTTFPYEVAAMVGEKMPEGLAIADQIIYLGLYWIYASSRKGFINREDARRMKIGLIQDCSHFRFRDELGAHWAELLKTTELARAAYRKERTLENADRLLAAIDGIPCKGGTK